MIYNSPKVPITFMLEPPLIRIKLPFLAPSCPFRHLRKNRKEGWLNEGIADITAIRLHPCLRLGPLETYPMTDVAVKRGERFGSRWMVERSNLGRASTDERSVKMMRRQSGGTESDV